MSQKAAMRQRRRWSIKFRDVARLGRPVYPSPISAEKSSARLRALIDKQQKMKQKKS